MDFALLNLAISSVTLAGVLGTGVMVGRVLQTLKDHERRISELEEAHPRADAMGAGR